MTIDIIRDKFLAPILITLFFGLFYFRKTSDWIFLVSLLIIILTIMCLLFYFKNDYYIQNYSIENGSLKIQYQKNFSEKHSSIFITDSKSIESVKFNSKLFLDTFHVISFKYIDNDGLYGKKVFKTNSDKIFIEIIHYLKQ